MSRRHFLPMSPADKASLLVLMKRADKARRFPRNTDPWSRHVHLMADNLPRKGGYPMLAEEPVHCAESMLVTLALLWETRDKLRKAESEIDRLRKCLAQVQLQEPKA